MVFKDNRKTPTTAESLYFLSLHYEKLSEDVKEIKEDNKKITNAIYGNGKPGIKQELAVLQNTVKEHDKTEQKGKENTKWWIRLSIAIPGAVWTGFNIFNFFKSKG